MSSLASSQRHRCQVISRDVLCWALRGQDGCLFGKIRLYVYFPSFALYILSVLPVLLPILCCFPILFIQMYEHLIFFPQGDSGGPLVVHHNGRWVLSGITSAGFGCAVDHQPGIYHKVSVTSGWLAANVRP